MAGVIEVTRIYEATAYLRDDRYRLDPDAWAQAEEIRLSTGWQPDWSTIRPWVDTQEVEYLLLTYRERRALCLKKLEQDVVPVWMRNRRGDPRMERALEAYRTENYALMLRSRNGLYDWRTELPEAADAPMFHLAECAEELLETRYLLGCSDWGTYKMWVEWEDRANRGLPSRVKDREDDLAFTEVMNLACTDRYADRPLPLLPERW